MSDFDEAFSSLFDFESSGLDKPLSPNDKFYNYLVSGSNPRILVIKWFLKNHLSVDEYFESQGCRYTRAKGVGGSENVSRADKVRVLIRNYLEMSHASRFDPKILGRDDVCDLETMVDKLFGNEHVQEVVRHIDKNFVRNL